jgi:hypothetical protein
MERRGSMKYRSAVALVLASMQSGFVIPAEPLPSEMNGKWNGLFPGGQAVDWTWTVSITKQNPDGSFEAIVDVSGGVNCWTKKQKTTGTYDGAVLALIMPREPQAQCGNITLELRRSAAHLFEGVGSLRMRDVKIYLDPTK